MAYGVTKFVSSHLDTRNLIKQWVSALFIQGASTPAEWGEARRQLDVQSGKENFSALRVTKSHFYQRSL
jgi:hypothetical protein